MAFILWEVGGHWIVDNGSINRVKDRRKSFYKKDKFTLEIINLIQVAMFNRLLDI